MMNHEGHEELEEDGFPLVDSPSTQRSFDSSQDDKPPQNTE